MVGQNLGVCICQKWTLYVGHYDRHGIMIRCSGCLRIAGECWCR